MEQQEKSPGEEDVDEENNNKVSSSPSPSSSFCRSGVTSPTGTGSVSLESSSSVDAGGGGGGDMLLFSTAAAASSLLGGLGALAVSLKETAGGVVTFVHRSALSVAAEIAELEEGYNNQAMMDLAPYRLPWELPVIAPAASSDLDSTSKHEEACEGQGAQQKQEVVYREDADLKRKIFLLSADEKTFLTPFSPQAEHNNSNNNKNANANDSSFILDEPRIQMIRLLLELDDNLATTHARLSGRSHVRESIFWQNYFYHCEQTRLAHMSSTAVATTSTAAAADSTATTTKTNESVVPNEHFNDKKAALLEVTTSTSTMSELQEPKSPVLPVVVDRVVTTTTSTTTTTNGEDDDDETSYVCVNNSDALVSPPPSLNWTEGDLLIVQNEHYYSPRRGDDDDDNNKNNYKNY